MMDIYSVEVLGMQVGSYRLTSQLGQGGMGVVYAAEHVLLGKRAAVKMLLPELSRDQEIVERFFREAKATTLIQHPGLVDIYDFGFHTDGSAFIVMEYLDGEALSARLRRDGRIADRELLQLSSQIADALAAAHARGIVHRDLKPDNIFLVRDAAVPGGVRTKILDFGIAKLVGDGMSAGAGNMTRTGALIGTPRYMSPEQCRGNIAVDHRSDIYSFGCIVYEMIAGRPPFLQDGLGELLAAHIYEPPPPLATWAPVSPEMEALILRALAKTPNERIQSSAELASALAALPVITLDGKSTAPVIVAPSSVAPPTATTTLGRGSGEATPRPDAAPRSAPRGRWVYGVAAAVVVVGAIVAGMRLRERPAAVAPPPPTAAVAIEPPAQPPTPAVAAPTVPPNVSLRIESTPPGASVFRAADGVHLGVTPLVDRVTRADGSAAYVVKLDGYADASLSISAAHDGTGAVALAKLERPHHRSSRRGSPAPTTTSHERRVGNGVLDDPFARH